MALDTSILSRIRPVDIASNEAPDPFAQAAKGLNLSALMTQTQQAKQGLADDTAIRNAYQQAGGDPGKLRDLLIQGGNYKQVQALDAAQLDNKVKTSTIAQHEATTSKTKYDQGIAEMEHVGSMLAAAKQNPAIYPEVKKQLTLINPKAAATLPEQYDPNQLDAIIAQGQTLTQRLTAERESATAAETARYHRDSTATTRRGQDMTDDRARATAEASLSKPFEITGPDGQPVLVQQDKAGNITPVQGYSPKSNGKPLTDSQSKALLFGSRMREADKILAGLSKEGTTTSIPGSRAPLIGGMVSALSSDNRQMLDQAKLDFMTAVLRRESGAAISSGEFDQANKQYFPQIGDSEGVKKQKAANRALAMQGVLAEVPEKQRGSLQPEAPAMPPSPNSVTAPDGTVLNFPSGAAAQAFKKAHGLK